MEIVAPTRVELPCPLWEERAESRVGREEMSFFFPMLPLGIYPMHADWQSNLSFFLKRNRS